MGEYFTELLNIKDDENAVAELEDDEILTEDDNTLTVRKVRQVMKEMKHGKAPGDNGTQFKLLGAGGSVLLNNY